jgi:hypothetical protein
LQALLHPAGKGARAVVDAVGGDLYTMPLTAGASAKIVNVPLVRLYPYSLRLSVVNNAGVALAASGNEIYVRAFNEDVT